MHGRYRQIYKIYKMTKNKGVNYSDMIKCRQLSDGIKYAMEDWLYDNK